MNNSTVTHNPFVTGPYPGLGYSQCEYAIGILVDTTCIGISDREIEETMKDSDPVAEETVVTVGKCIA